MEVWKVWKVIQPFFIENKKNIKKYIVSLHTFHTT